MARRLLQLTLAAALAALLAGCGSAPAKPGVSIHIDTSPFGVTILRDGKPVVAEDSGARLRYELASGAQHKLTKLISANADSYVVATDEPGRTAVVTVDVSSDAVRIHAHLRPQAAKARFYDSFDVPAGAHFLGGGEQRDQVDLRGAIVPIKVSSACGYAPAPFFASSAGWGLLLDGYDVSALAFPGSAGGTGCQFGADPACSFPALTDRVEDCSTGGELSERIFLGSLPKILASYQATTGPARVPPPSELALVKWRDSVTGPAQVLEDVTRLQSAGIPIGWVLLDNPWETCVGSLTFDRTRIPDPAALIGEVHALGVKFMLWVSPKILCNPGYPASALLGNPADQVEIDLSKTAVSTAFQAKLRKLVALGIDGVKADRADEVDLEPIGSADQNVYPVRYANIVVSALPKGAAAIFQAASPGSQRVIPGLWAGDQDGTFDGLQEAIRAGESASMSGFPTWGSDVGGYHSVGETAELFERWAQFGAVSPIMEVGGQGANATPWTLGAEAMSVLKASAILHYELFPLLYGLLEHHQPVLRPLGYAYPDDPQAWSAEYEFLVGPDLLAAPVVGGGTTPSVYLPSGPWIDLYTGDLATSGQVFTRPTPDTQFPFYVRQGAVVPFNLRTADSWWGVDEQAHPGRAGWLTTNFANLDLRGQPHDVQIFVPAPEPPLRVTVAGRNVSWTWNPGPMPGVVVRLHGPTVRGKIVLSRT
jgi:alpha-D-xyloside xylohydrolase